MSGNISHDGMITGIDGNCINVRILQSSACSSCQAKSLCRVSESKEKDVQVYVANSDGYAVGQQVRVIATEKQGWKAVLIAFVIPLALLMAMLVGSQVFHASETASALMALGILVPYYLVVALMRDRIKGMMGFGIE